jgi:hypothetical protein
MIARRFNCSVIVIRHLTKGSKEKAMYRGQGSMSFTGSARVVVGFAKVPNEDGMLAMVQHKNNLAREAPALTYELEACPTLKNPDATRVVWGEYREDMDKEALFRSPDKKESSGGREEAEELIKDMCDAGPRDAKDIEREADKRGISKTTLHRAAKKLNVIMRISGFGASRKSMWELPDVKKPSAGNKARPSPRP